MKTSLISRHFVVRYIAIKRKSIYWKLAVQDVSKDWRCVLTIDEVDWGGREQWEALIDKGSRTFSRDIDIWKVQNVSDTCDSILRRLPIDILPWIRLRLLKKILLWWIVNISIILIFFKKCIVSLLEKE